MTTPCKVLATVFIAASAAAFAVTAVAAPIAVPSSVHATGVAQPRQNWDGL